MSSGWAQLATVAGSPVPDLPATRQRQTISSPQTGFATIDDELTRRAAHTATPAETLGLPTVYACVRVIAHTVEQLPLDAHCRRTAATPARMDTRARDIQRLDTAAARRAVVG